MDNYRRDLYSSMVDGGTDVMNPSEDQCLYGGRWGVRRGLFQSCTHHKGDISNDEISRAALNRY